MANEEYQSIYHDFAAIINDQHDIDLNEIRPESNLSADLGLDSLDIAELLMEIEDKFDITVPDDIGETIFTVDDAVKAIQNIQK